MTIESLKAKNQYPIVFIGSGMAKRYILNSPDWLSLLEEYWNMLDNEQNFYSYLNELRERLRSENPLFSDERLIFMVNAKAASYIQKQFDSTYNQNPALVPSLSSKTVFLKQLSPFKFSLAERFSHLTFIKDMEDELKLFATVLSKAKMVITTNYDDMIEQLLAEQNKSADVFVGSSGFFKETTGWGELYKIHGTNSDSETIVITDEDYQRFDSNSILLNAKLLTSLVDSPILFLGYSMTDENVRSLLQSYANNLPTDVSKNSDRITIVEYKSGESTVSENVEHDPLLGINYTRVQTDNYAELFSQISQINQGVSPAYIRKYQQTFKQIIEVKGRKGQLDTFLTYANNIDDMPEEQRLQNTAIAIGDRAYLFVIPTLVDYLTDYLTESDSTEIQVAARFLAQQQPNANLPYLRILKRIKQDGDIGLTEAENRKIKTRIEKTPTLDELIANIAIPKHLEPKLIENIDEIWRDQSITELSRINLVIKVIKSHSSDIKPFVIETALPRFIENFQTGLNDNNGIRTAYRRLFLAYDLLVNETIQQKIAPVE
ncbi:SIR2 family protein [Weissella cibaria]|nr:SIR2 family protein [Weissella cibaria]